MRTTHDNKNSSPSKDLREKKEGLKDGRNVRAAEELAVT